MRLRDEYVDEDDDGVLETESDVVDGVVPKDTSFFPHLPTHQLNGAGFVLPDWATNPRPR